MYHVAFAEGLWSVFNDTKGTISNSQSLVDSILKATDEEPKASEFFLHFTKSGAIQIRKLNP